MYENKEKPELELCYEKRELQSGSYARKNQGLWSWSHIHERENLQSQSSFILVSAPQPCVQALKMHILMYYMGVH